MLRCVDGKLPNGKPLNVPYCEASNVVIDFEKSAGGCYVMYRRFVDGGLAFGGCSSLDPALKDHANANCGTSWGQELAEAVPLPIYNSSACDIKISEPTLLVKTDFPHHIYHHFTSILNAWLSLHIAQLPTDGSIRIAFLDKFNHRIPLDNPHEQFLGTFSEAWYPFTKHPVLDTRHFAPKTGKTLKVCFDHAIFSYPPRASFFYPTRGLGCSSSNLMTSYVDWLLNNMTLSSLGQTDDTLTITYVSRSATGRVVLNEMELVAAMRDRLMPHVQVKLVDFSGMKFREQISIVRKTDILVGMHGAGLTNLLWLPRQYKRVAIVEIFNTYDEFCYKDLAALNGIKYFTWTAEVAELHPSIPVEELSPRNAKQTNYAPNMNEFISLMEKAVEHVSKTSTPHTSEL